MLSLREDTAFLQGSALNMPFPDRSFDVVWTEAVQMNVANKRAFYAEIARVLSPGGRFAFHDIFRGDGGELYYPVPWANESSISFLAQPDAVREILGGLQLKIVHWEEKSQQCVKWLAAAVERSDAADQKCLGLHLLMGGTARVKLENNIRNLTEGRFVVIQAIAVKG
jgi:ubiquinone/menaquinone biosynthesis C-methylase UbiE